jgi:hypothetical protein
VALPKRGKAFPHCIVSDLAPTKAVVAKRIQEVEILEEQFFAEPQEVETAIYMRAIRDSYPLFREYIRYLERDRSACLEALETIAEGERLCCQRCEGNGALWADGKAHYPSENMPTRPCPECGGSGKLPAEDPSEIASEVLSSLSVKDE